MDETNVSKEVRITFGSKAYIIIAVIWLLMGLLSLMLVCIHDMRGNSYDENYFEGGMSYVIGLILMGGFSFLLCAFDIFRERHKKRKNKRIFTKFIYKIANIGIKKDGDKK